MTEEEIFDYIRYGKCEGGCETRAFDLTCQEIGTEHHICPLINNNNETCNCCDNCIKECENCYERLFG